MFSLFKTTISNSFHSTFSRFNSNFSKSNLKKVLETMPKEKQHIQEAQKQRIKYKEKLQKYVPGKVTLQVLGTGAVGAPKSLYMFTDQSRYLFNCGEGTQRLAHEHKMKLAKLEHIFITHPNWDNIGGLPGVSLTIQDVGVPQIILHGPQGLDELFIATRRFIVLKDLTIQMADCNPSVQFEDNVMSVTYVPITKTQNISSDSMTPLEDDNSQEKGIQAGIDSMDASTSTRREDNRSRRKSWTNNISPIEVEASTMNNKQNRGKSNSRSSSDDDTDYYAHETSGRRLDFDPIPPELLSEREQNTTMCYICRLNPRPGALSLEKCVEFGIPPGPLLGQLKAGNDITLDSGVVVKSSDVCLPDDPGPVMIIVDCPSIEYLDAFVNNEQFIKHQATAQNDDDLAYVVIHFTPEKITQDPRYRSWIDKFSLSTQHIVMNESNTCMGSIAVHRIQHKLNMLHKDIFPLLGDNGSKTLEENTCRSGRKKLKTDSSDQSKLENSRPATPDDIFIHTNTFCNIHIRPKKGFDRSEELQLVPAQYIEETMAEEGFPDALKELKEKLNCTRNLNIKEYPRVLFLGTGSCIPNKTRNTSGIYIETGDNSGFLMDCGEGTYGQIVRFYGYDRARTILANLNAIYVSHLHADHHIGLIGVLKGRRTALNSLGLPFKPLMLIAPRQIQTWLHFYHRRFETISDDYELIASGDMVLGDHKLSESEIKKLFDHLGMSDVSTVLVRHCPNAFGVAFTHRNGWKLTYSGDTMPCESLVRLGLNSDLLIHEATMEDELAHEAISKMHSTTTQAITIGQDMKAKHILLTHFSQRYAKLPRFNDNFAENVGIAFDNMQVRLDELPLVPLLYPALKLMFAEHYEELEHKAVKRQLKAERRGTSLDRQPMK